MLTLATVFSCPFQLSLPSAALASPKACKHCRNAACIRTPFSKIKCVIYCGIIGERESKIVLKNRPCFVWRHLFSVGWSGVSLAHVLSSIFLARCTVQHRSLHQSNLSLWVGIFVSLFSGPRLIYTHFYFLFVFPNTEVCILQIKDYINSVTKP